MGRYIYQNLQGQGLSAPIIKVELSNPADTNKSISVPALLDTGADFTHVPVTYLRKIEAQPSGRAKIHGVNSTTSTILYSISFKIDMTTYKTVDVCAWERENMNFILVGRNILNKKHIIYLGPQNRVDFYYKKGAAKESFHSRFRR